MRDTFENAVFSAGVGSLSAHMLAAGMPAVHVTFVQKASDIFGAVTAYRSFSNVSVVFNTMEQGLAATSYSDSSLRRAIRSSIVKHVDFSLDDTLLQSDRSPPEPRSSFGFRWSGFFKPEQAGIW